MGAGEAPQTAQASSTKEKPTRAKPGDGGHRSPVTTAVTGTDTQVCRREVALPFLPPGLAQKRALLDLTSSQKRHPGPPLPSLCPQVDSPNTHYP